MDQLEAAGLELVEEDAFVLPDGNGEEHEGRLQLQTDETGQNGVSSNAAATRDEAEEAPVEATLDNVEMETGISPTELGLAVVTATKALAIAGASSSQGNGDFQMVATTKCNRLAYYKGYLYVLDIQKRYRSYWRCRRRKCYGRMRVFQKDHSIPPVSAANLRPDMDLDINESEKLTKKKVTERIVLYGDGNYHDHPPFDSYEDVINEYSKFATRSSLRGEEGVRQREEWSKKLGLKPGKIILPGLPIPKKKVYNVRTKPLVDPKTYLHIVCEMHHTKKKGKMLFAEGHLYHATKQRGTKIYWRCRNRPCAATVATNRDGDGVYRIIHKGHPHAEPSSPSYAEALKLSGRMANLRRVQKQTGVAMVSLALDDQDILDTDYNTDYFVQDDLDGGDGPEDDNDSDYSMADEGSFANETVNEEIIVVEACLTLGGEKFLQEIVMADDGTKILLFVTRQNLEYLSLASSWTMDSISSEKLPDLFTHLFTVRARVRYGDPLPLAYALMTNSSHEAFRALFIDLQVLATGYKTKLNPVRVVTELDEGVIKACQEVFDETRVMVSHYHYSRAIWDRAHYCQMNHDYVDAEFLKESTKKLKALAFLPENQIKEAWKELKCNLQDDQGQIVNWFEEVFVLGPIIKAIDDVTFHSTATFQPSSWSQEPLLPMGNSRDPLRNLLTDSFKEWHYKWTGLLQGMDGEGVNPLIEVLKKEQEETERVIGQRLACQDRHLLGDALSDVLANRPTRKGVDLVNEVSLLLDMEDPIPSSSFSLEIIQG